MRTALDTNILSGLIAATTQTAMIATQLEVCSSRGSLVISPAVYAEALAHPGMTVSFLRSFLEQTGILIDYSLDEPIWTEAGVRFAQYAVRRRKSSGEFPRRLIADFLIGAHSLARADCLMTYDIRFYQQNFPELTLYPLPGL